METKQLVEKAKYGLLDETDAYHCMKHLCDTAIPQEQKASILSTIENRQVTHKELSGFSSYLLESCIKPFEYAEDVVDVCGTGGDGNHTINISTLSALVLASTGVKVCKHGNYGATSVNGSSNILEYLGYTFKNKADDLLHELDRCNITFLHAPLFHPQLKHVKDLRSNLAMRTVFNVLGPMVNPLRPRYRYTGVSSLGIARLYHYSYQAMDIQYNIVFSLDGNDEITLTDKVKVFSHAGEEFIYPYELSSHKVNISDIQIEKSLDSAAILFKKVLNARSKSVLTEVVVVNAAKAYMLRKNTNYQLAYQICNEALLSGKTSLLFNKLIQ